MPSGVNVPLTFEIYKVDPKGDQYVRTETLTQDIIKVGKLSSSHLRIDELFRRVEANGVEEVVLAMNPNMTGEATAGFLADRLRGRVRVTRLASGLPVGGDLEYADEVTLGRALSGRREM